MRRLVLCFLLIGFTYASTPTGGHCVSEDPLETQGVCLSSHDCRKQGGRDKGKCGAFHVCCLFERTCDASSPEEDPVYFRNVAYSQSDNTIGPCAFHYNYAGNVCGVKLTFIDFRIAGPNTNNFCDRDYFLILEGSPSHFEPQCGDQTGKEFLIPVNPGGGIFTVLMYRTSGLDSIWNIKFNPLHCSEKGVPTPRNWIDNAIISALESLREGMVNGYPDLGIPPLDPLIVEKIDLNIHNNSTRLEGALTNITVSNLATFELTSISSSIFGLWAKVNLSIPLLDVQGQYHMKGDVGGLFPIFGSGPFVIDASTISLYGYINLDLLTKMTVSSIDLDLHADETLIVFEGIEGGGEMADFVNGVLSALGPEIIQKVADQFLPYLEEALKEEINNLLHPPPTNITTLPPAPHSERDDSVNEFFDMVFANIRKDIIDADLDPIALPSDQGDFNVNIFNTSLTGNLWVGSGSVAGLSSIHRDGDMVLQYVGEEKEVIVGGTVGLIDLEAEYSYLLSLGPLSHGLSLSVKMTHLSLEVETDVFINQEEITLKRCNITDLGSTHMHIEGAGPVDSALYNLLANGLLGALKGEVASAVSATVCYYLELAISGGAP